MKMKEELGFDLKVNPIITSFKRADKILKRIVLEDALNRMYAY
jgi:hypothetical protein